MKLSKKMVRLIVAILLVVGMVPASVMTVFAADTHKHCVCGGNTDIGDHTSHSDIEFTPWTSTNAMPTATGNYVLMDNVTLSNSWKPANGTVLCLNGHTLSAPIIDVQQDCKFTLCDCGNGKIAAVNPYPDMIYLNTDSNFNMYGGEIDGGGCMRVVTIVNAKFNMYNGTIKGGKATSELGGGGGVRNLGTFTMYGGSITGNTSEESGGGVYNDGTFTMNGGSITGNQSTQNAGGGVYNIKNATYTMNGGSITNNTSKETGGGVHNEGIFIMTGDEISGNSSTNSTGGGVWSATEASISISGDAVIKDNTGKGEINNLHLASNGTTDAKITIGELGSNASIGVSVDSNHGMIISERGKDHKDNFFSDNGVYAVAVNGENLTLVEKTVQVGMVTLDNDEYTTNGKDKATGTPTGTGYAYFENGVLTLNNFTYSGGGGNNAAIYCEYALTIKVEGENKIERVKTDADTHTTYTIRGIWSNNYLKIIGDDRNDFLEVVASGHDDAFAVAIGGDWQGIVIENCTLEAKSLTGGKGLDLAGDLTITGSKVISTSSATVGDINTQGIYAETLKVTDSDVVGIATDTTDGEADGIYLDGDTAKLIFVSGSIIAETSDGASGRYAIYKATNLAELPTTYWMRTSASGEYVNGTWDGANIGPYIELTTTEHHVHSYTRKTNDTQHWMECVCGTVQNGSLEDHKGGTATCTAKAKCSECGEEYGDYGAHHWDADWTTDSEKHWHTCLNTGCTEIKDDNLHSGGTATCMELAKCEFCDMAYGGQLSHTYGADWKRDKDSHWHECTCGEKKDAAGHTGQVVNAREATETAKGYTGDTVCSACGYELAKGTDIPVKTPEDSKPAEDPAPPTGDSFPLLLWALLALLSAAGAVTVLRKRRV